MPIGFYSEVKLTGKKRVRRGWQGKMILQVEVERVFIHPAHGRPWVRHPGDNPVSLVWRDATAKDVGLETAPIDAIAPLTT